VPGLEPGLWKTDVLGHTDESDDFRHRLVILCTGCSHAADVNHTSSGTAEYCVSGFKNMYIWGPKVHIWGYKTGYLDGKMRYLRYTKVGKAFCSISLPVGRQRTIPSAEAAATPPS
jgi:hypothetical protein